MLAKLFQIGLLALAVVPGAWTGQAMAQSEAADLAVPDYSNATAWLCRPGSMEPCGIDVGYVDLETGAVVAVPEPVNEPDIDCFYVYPTVSHAPGLNAPIALTDDERRAAALQIARFRTVCRLYVPLYRQLTVSEMARSIEGRGASDLSEAIAMAEADVEAAWLHYVQHDNQGRGFILMGHSQGANILHGVIRDHIENTPMADRLISAVLPGGFVSAPEGQDVGGTFKSTPVCRSEGQIACVIVFNAFRRSLPPPEDYPVVFGDNERLLCSNPAALAGDEGLLISYLASDGISIIPEFTQPPVGWPDYPAPYVRTSETLRAECVTDAHGTWFAVEAVGAEYENRLYGDFVVDGQRHASMGLHLIDLELVTGNLIKIFELQAATYAENVARKR